MIEDSLLRTTPVSQDLVVGDVQDLEGESTFYRLLESEDILFFSALALQDVAESFYCPVGNLIDLVGDLSGSSLSLGPLFSELLQGFEFGALLTATI